MVGALVDYADFSESAAGWVASAGFAGGAGAAILLALRIRHLDPRKLALAGLITIAVADSLSALATKMPLPVFLGLRVVSGVGGATAYAAVMATIAASAMPERGYGIFSVFQFALSAVGLYVLPLVLSDIGVIGMYLGLAAAAVLAIPLFGSVLTREQTAVSTDPAIEIHMLLKPAAILAMLGIGLYEAANTMHFTYAERIGVSFGLADYRIGEILGIATVVGIPAAFGAAWLGDNGHIAVVDSCSGSTNTLFGSGRLYAFDVCIGHRLGIWLALFPVSGSAARPWRQHRCRGRLLYIGRWRVRTSDSRDACRRAGLCGCAN